MSYGLRPFKGAEKVEAQLQKKFSYRLCLFCFILRPETSNN